MGKRSDSDEIRHALAIFSQLGIRMAACLFLGIFGAKLLVDRFGFPLWITLIGALLGFGAAFKTMYDLVIREWMK